MKQIWAKNLRDEKNIALLFVCEKRIGKDAVLSLACNVPFRLKIDGELFSYGPRRMAHGRAAVNRYSLSAYEGRSVRIEAEAVSYRVRNFYIVDQPPFFAAEMTENGKTVADSFDFQAFRNRSKLQKVQRFSYQRGFVEAYEMDGGYRLEPVETDEKEVCTLEECAAPYPKFTVLRAEEFENGRVFERPEFSEFDDSRLNRRGTPHFAREDQEYRISLEYDRLGFGRTDSESEFLSGGYKAYRLPRNAAGFVAFDAEVTEDADLLIAYDEILSSASDARLKNGAANIDVHRLDETLSLIGYKLTKGTYRLTAFEADEMQYMRFCVLRGKARISNVRLITYENECINIKFSSHDHDVKLLFEAAVNSFKPNAVDILTDCPSRERAGWLCDSYFTGRAEKILTGRNDVEKNFLQAFLEMPSGAANIPEEVFPMCYPCDHAVKDRYIPNWCMWLILELESYLQRSGDRALIDKYENKILRYIEYTLKFLNADGLLEDPEGWIFVEWSRANDLTKGVNYPTNMLFSAALRAVSRLYGVKKYAEIAEKADKNIRKQSFNGRFFVDNALKNAENRWEINTEWTETCQYYAFYFGYASREKTPELFRIMFDEICGYADVSHKYPKMSRSDSFIGLYLRLDYLSRIGEHERVIRDLKKYFLFQAKETKTFWEYKDARGSCCHAFASIICEWILKAVQKL